MKEHVFNILTEAGYETVGSLMFVLKTDPNKVLGLPGIGSKAMQNIEEALAALTFPEPAPEAEPAPVAETAPVDQPEAVVKVEEQPVAVTAVAEPVKVEEAPVTKKQAEKKEKKQPVEVVEDDEHAKDGVALDELFKMKPEIFQNADGAEEETNGEKKKGKKGKKKAVELEFDEDLGEVVGRKIHKRGEAESDWE
jgi:cell division septation protein DedD